MPVGCADTTLHLQLLSLQPDDAVLRLIDFITGLGNANKCSYRFWSNGLVLKGKAYASEIVKLCRDAKLNLAEFRYDPKQSFPFFGRNLIRLEASFELSPLNAYWSPLGDVPFEDRRTEDTRLSLLSLVNHIAFHELETYPSILDCCFTVAISDLNTLYDCCFTLLCRALEYWNAPIVSFGLARANPCGMNVLKRLAPFPSQVCLLGDLFYDLDPIMIGAAHSARQLIDIIGGGQIERFGELAVIRLDAEVCNQANRERVMKLIVKREQKRRGGAPILG